VNKLSYVIVAEGFGVITDSSKSIIILVKVLKKKRLQLSKRNALVPKQAARSRALIVFEIHLFLV